MRIRTNDYEIPSTRFQETAILNDSKSSCWIFKDSQTFTGLKDTLRSFTILQSPKVLYYKIDGKCDGKVNKTVKALQGMTKANGHFLSNPVKGQERRGENSRVLTLVIRWSSRRKRNNGQRRTTTASISFRALSLSARIHFSKKSYDERRLKLTLYCCICCIFPQERNRWSLLTSFLFFLLHFSSMTNGHFFFLCTQNITDKYVLREM